ncbi:Alcohol_dehydrogenase [Hexamita inflata]|uniref:Alcohol_dehydrogenase n=1 Tax=Hexamita inflata TaxID=28002 RepID=A0ABP1J6U8_9EUKA
MVKRTLTSNKNNVIYYKEDINFKFESSALRVIATNRICILLILYLYIAYNLSFQNEKEKQQLSNLQLLYKYNNNILRYSQSVLASNISLIGQFVIDSKQPVIGEAERNELLKVFMMRPVCLYYPTGCLPEEIARDTFKYM